MTRGKQAQVFIAQLRKELDTDNSIYACWRSRFRATGRHTDKATVTLPNAGFLKGFKVPHPPIAANGSNRMTVPHQLDIAQYCPSPSGLL
jgi:hypothetical protein